MLWGARASQCGPQLNHLGRFILGPQTTLLQQIPQVWWGAGPGISTLNNLSI